MPALGNSRRRAAGVNSRRRAAGVNSRGSLRFAPLCTHTEHSLLAVYTLLTGAVRARTGQFAGGALHSVPLCTHTEHSLLAVFRQHRTKTALRLSTTSACSFSVILHKTRLITVRLTALVLHILTKKLAAHLRHYLCAVLPLLC